MTNLDTILKSRDITLLTKIHIVKAMVFPIVIYGCEIWTVKNAKCLKNQSFWAVVLEKTLEGPLDCKEIKPVNHKGNQSWTFIGMTDTETKVLILWTPYGKNSLIRKDPDVGKYWRQKDKGTTKYGMVGWHYWLNGHAFEQALGVVDREAWYAAVHGVASSRTWPSDWNELILITKIREQIGNKWIVFGSFNLWKISNRSMWRVWPFLDVRRQ